AFARLKHGPLGHVARRAIGIMSGDDELLFLMELKQSFVRHDADTLQFRLVGRSSRRPGLNPAEDRFVIAIADGNLLAAAMGNKARRLLQKQALFRRSRKNAAAARFEND